MSTALPDNNHELLVIYNNGAHHAQAIARKAREMGVYAEVWPISKPVSELNARKAKGAIFAETDNFDTEMHKVYEQCCDNRTGILPKDLNNDKLFDNILTTFGFSRDWTMEKVLKTETARIEASVGRDEKVICALSGGVDSLVSATMTHRAVGDRLTCIFVDHGLMRYNEAAEITELFTERFGAGFVSVDASDRFLGKLAGITDPETKRKIIGNEFISVFEEEARKVGGAKWLVQGTIYPDIIESGVSGHKLVKRHHNVGGLPEKMNLKLIEPLRHLFKNEVRDIGRLLQLPEAHVARQPFPGPGLAIRVVGGAVNREILAKLALADHIVRTEIEKANLQKGLGQYFAAIPAGLNVVGARDGERFEDQIVFVRAVATTDYMTAEPAEIPFPVQRKISDEICGKIGAARVLFDMTRKPPATIEYE